MSGLPPVGQWKPNVPPVDAEVVLGGRYRFRVTLHGPNTQHACVDCGGVCYGIPDCPEPLCGGCRLDRCGALAGTGRLALAEHPPRRL